MKKLSLYLLVILFAFPTITQSKVWRVNNNAGVAADFSNLDDAMAAYANGDSIYLEPSAINYTVASDEFNTGQRFVTILGNGYKLTNNDGLQENTLSSTISSNNLNGISVKRNIRFVGIIFNDRIDFIQDISGTDTIFFNLSFESCLFTKNQYNTLTGIASAPVSSITFIKNFFPAGFNFSNESGSVITNFTFENNIVVVPDIGQRLGVRLKYHTTPAYQNIVRNNIFVSYEIHSGGSFSYCYLANNIFKELGAAEIYNCVSRNNLFYRPTYYDAATIVENDLTQIDMSNVFQSTLTEKDNYFQLKTGSPAIGAGVLNEGTPVDCGAFGGPNPYKLSGIPAIPSIYFLQLPAIINKGTDTHITLKSRSNN